jgi:probable HAF family extracellular repeat protein
MNIKTRLTPVLVTVVVMALVSSGLLGPSLVPTALAAPAITITDLGSLGGDDSRAEGINNHGQIVGMSTTTTHGQRRAFLWKDGVMTNLGSLGGHWGNPDEINSYAYEINNLGQIVGFCRYELDPLNPYWRSFLWENGEMTDLRYGGRVDAAYGINDQGQIVGMFYYGGRFRPFLWQDGEFTDLGALGWEGSEGSAYAINHLGQIVGQSGGRAFLWEDGVMTDLGTLGGNSRVAYAINNQGQIVGGSTTADGWNHAFLWQDGVMTDLGTPGGAYSVARGINDRGQIVGESSTADGSWRAFLWQDGVMTNLGTLGGNSSAAYAINDHGQIVGYSTTADGQHRATLWVVSAPVLTPEQALASLVADLESLVTDGRLEARWAHGLRAKLEVAQLQLDKGNTTASANVLGAFINQVGATVNSGRLTPEAAQPLNDGAHVVIELLQP